MRRSGVALMASFGIAAGALAACSSEPPAESVAWVEGVCAAYGELDAALKSLDDEFDPIDPTMASTITSAIEELRDRVNGVRSGADNLKAAVSTDLPPQAQEALSRVKSSVTTSIDAARESVATLPAAVATLIQEPSSANVDALTSAADAARTDLNAVVDELRTAADSASDELESVVRAAPACAPYLPPES